MAGFENGLIVGRFQTFHTGHQEIIEKALAVCEKVLQFVGSSQESMTAKNPFSYELRETMLKSCFPEAVAEGRLIIAPLPDAGLGNVPAWGRYVLDQAKERFDMVPELLVSGKEPRRVSWFDNEGVVMHELYLDKEIEISATMMREFFLSDDEENWRKYSPKALWPMYDRLRDVVIASQENTETASM